MTILRIRRPAGLLGYSNKPAVILLGKLMYICNVIELTVRIICHGSFRRG